MVDFSSGSGGLIEHGFSNSVFIIPGILTFALLGYTVSESSEGQGAEAAAGGVGWRLAAFLVGEGLWAMYDCGCESFCGYKLFLCLSERENKREEKRKLKQKKKK